MFAARLLCFKAVRRTHDPAGGSFQRQRSTLALQSHSEAITGSSLPCGTATCSMNSSLPPDFRTRSTSWRARCWLLTQQRTRVLITASMLSSATGKVPRWAFGSHRHSQSICLLVQVGVHGPILSCTTLSVFSLTSNHFATTVPNWRCS